MHLIYSTKFCRSIVLDFSWDDCYTQEKLETVVMQNSGWVNKVHYGLCGNSKYGDVLLNKAEGHLIFNSA